MHWLGVLFVVFLLVLFRVRKNIFSLGSLLVIVGYLATMNLMNVDYYIAERNIARYHDGHELDIAFLDILSVDAAPAILPLYAESEKDAEVHQWSGQWLRRKLMALDTTHNGMGATVFSANVSREAAWTQLSDVEGSLPDYDPSLYWGSYYGSYFGTNDDFGSGYGSGWSIIATDEPR
jgi:hypothetical protein